jgi:cytochrome c-type biogenesis protein CcmH
MFYAVAAGLLCLALVLILVLPRYWRGSRISENTLDWLRLRQSELAQEERLAGAELSELRLDAEVRVLDELDVGRASQQGQRHPEGGLPAGVLGLLVAVVLIAPVVVYEGVGGYRDVQIADKLAALDPTVAGSVEELVRSISDRSAQRPGNADYLAILGDYFTAQGEHAKALERYEQLLTLFPESPEILAKAAQAEYLQGERELSNRAKNRAESALAADPNQGVALGTLGMAAFEAAAYADAARYWERLLALEPPGSPGAQMLSELVAEARARMDGPVAGVEDPIDDSRTRVTVSVALPAGAEVSSGSIFVLARPANSNQRMPIAVVRRSVADLPLEVTLDDSNSMAGQSLSTLDRADIEVQLSPSGQPGLQNASWTVLAENVELGPDIRVDLVLQPSK